MTVYSNLPEVELIRNGESLGKKQSDNHFFYFDVPNVGESKLVAVAGEYTDESTIRKVEEMNQDYILKEKGAILNWFDVEAPEGRFSLNDKFGDILSTLRGKLWALRFGLTIKKKMDANKKNGNAKIGGMGEGMNMKSILPMLSGFTVLRDRKSVV